MLFSSASIPPPSSLKQNQFDLVMDPNRSKPNVLTQFSASQHPALAALWHVI